MNFEGFSTGNRAVQTITADVSELIRDYSESHADRLRSRGGHFTADELIPVYYCALVGYDNDDTYNNLLYNLRDTLAKSPKTLVFKDSEFSNPTPAEVARFGNVDRGNKTALISGICAGISVNSDPVRTEAARSAMKNILESSPDEPLSKLYNTGIILGCRFNRVYGAADFKNKVKEIPVFLYYGKIRSAELMLLYLLSCSGMDVIFISPDKSCLQLLADENRNSRMQIFELPNSKEIMPYPEKEVKAKVATAAYSAERELDTLLYGGDTMFRDFQFSDMEATTLKTTYDEIDILWNQPARFRPGFQVKGSRAVVPTLFAKISGVADGDIKAYWEGIEDKLTPDTLVTVKAPGYKEPTDYFRQYDPYHDGHRIFAEKLKASNVNTYTFLSDELQWLIIHKIQEAYDSGFFTVENDRERLQYLLYAGMNIDRKVLRIMQKYDFTKNIPKFIIIDAIEDTFNKVECAQLILFSMLGFDVVVYTPTGYRNIETYISSDAFEIHQMNDFKYNVRVPQFKIPDKMPQPKSKGGLFSNLFKKGRK